MTFSHKATLFSPTFTPLIFIVFLHDSLSYLSLSHQRKLKFNFVLSYWMMLFFFYFLLIISHSLSLLSPAVIPPLFTLLSLFECLLPPHVFCMFYVKQGVYFLLVFQISSLTSSHIFQRFLKKTSQSINNALFFSFVVNQAHLSWGLAEVGKW